MSYPLNEIKTALRKIEFPYNAIDALMKAEDLLSTNSYNNRPQSKQTEYAMEIVTEFVFNEVDWRGMKKKLTYIQELELITVLSDHMMLDNSGNEASRNALFLSLFPVLHKERVRLLVMLVSLSISTRNIPVLNAAGILIQQVGCTSAYSSSFAQYLLEDFFSLVYKNSLAVIDLPKLAPLFTANFLTALAAGYGFIEGKSPIPTHMLEIIVDWVVQNPSLCFSTLLLKLQPTLPQGAILMPAITPYIGLIKWCIIANLKEPDDEELYDSLRKKLLQTLVESERVTDRMPNVINAQDLSTFIPTLAVFEKCDPSAFSLAINRFIEFLEVAVSTKSLYGSQQKLWQQVSKLPPSKKIEDLLIRMLHSH